MNNSWLTIMNVVTVTIINIISKKLTNMKKLNIFAIFVDFLLRRYYEWLNNCSPTWGIQILALDLLPVTVLRMLLRNLWRKLGRAKYLTSRRWKHYRRRTAIETCTICEILFPFLSANINNRQFYLFIDNIAGCCKQSLLKSVTNFHTIPGLPTHFSLLV